MYVMPYLMHAATITQGACRTRNPIPKCPRMSNSKLSAMSSSLYDRLALIYVSEVLGLPEPLVD